MDHTPKSVYKVNKTFFSSHHLNTEPALIQLVFNEANTLCVNFTRILLWIL
jgi:hypothetical protein